MDDLEFSQQPSSLVNDIGRSTMETTDPPDSNIEAVQFGWSKAYLRESPRLQATEVSRLPTFEPKDDIVERYAPLLFIMSGQV